jgi:hypothetical protein
MRGDLSTSKTSGTIKPYGEVVWIVHFCSLRWFLRSCLISRVPISGRTQLKGNEHPFALEFGSQLRRFSAQYDFDPIRLGGYAIIHSSHTTLRATVNGIDCSGRSVVNTYRSSRCPI